MSRILLLALAVSLLSAQVARAEPTEIVVRVMAKDGKFVGTSMGGAQIVLRDADSGEILAQGLTAGGTGSTPKIMTMPRTSREVLSDSDAAKYSVTLDLERPRRITATATGPMNPKEAAMTVSSTQWVVPGKSLNGGDGWVIELRGFAINLVDALPDEVRIARVYWGPTADSSSRWYASLSSLSNIDGRAWGRCEAAWDIARTRSGRV